MKMGFAIITDSAVDALRERIGVPMERVTPPFYTEINSDAARHFAWAIGDDNPLWVDPDYGPSTRWQSQLAPPTILFSTDNVVSGAVEGLPSVHAMYAGTDWRWFEPIKTGTALKTKSFLKDMVERETKFSGRSFQQIYTTEFFDQNGTKLAEADSWCFRTERDTAREQGTKYEKVGSKPKQVYSDEEIAQMQRQYLSEAPRGREKLLWHSVEVGDAIPAILKGPYTITSAVAFMQAWGAYAVRNHRLAWRYYDRHPSLANPNEHNVPEPPVRVHWDEAFAQTVGAPGAYDFGPERVAWAGQLLTDWFGDDGFLRQLTVRIRRHNIVGDALWYKGKVTAKRVEAGRHLVDCEIVAKNQDDELSAEGTATVELPAS
jgi:acyl dehydratase